MGFDQQFREKTMKNMIFHDFLAVWGLALGSLQFVCQEKFPCSDTFVAVLHNTALTNELVSEDNIQQSSEQFCLISSDT